jgi:hypothetical protein
MRIRLVHQQQVVGNLLIADIDSGLPNEPFGIYRKQPVYLPYYHTFFGGDGMVHVDRDVPGHIDLVLSDKVKLSADRGVIKGFEDSSLISVVELPVGGVPDSFVIEDAEQDDDDTGDVTITAEAGSSFISYAPAVTSVRLLDDADGSEVIFTDGDAEITITEGEIVITGFGGTDDTYVGGTAEVTVNGVTVAFTPIAATSA